MSTDNNILSTDNNILTLESRIQMLKTPEPTVEEFENTPSLCMYCKHSVITRYSMPNYKDVLEMGKPDQRVIRSISIATEVCCSQKYMRLIEHDVATCQIFQDIPD